MTGIGLSRSLQDLYEAADLALLRERLVRHVAELGFRCAGEFANCLQVTATYANPRKFIWDTLSDHVGSRRANLLEALFSAALSQGIEEENRRLRWMAAQKRPYLVLSSEAAQFKGNLEIYSVVRDFGLHAANILVVPLPDGGVSRLRLWAFPDTASAERNAQQAVTLMMVYNHMRQLLPAERTDFASRETASDDMAPTAARRDPMDVPPPTANASDLALAHAYRTREAAVRAYIEDHLNDPELGVDQLCRVFAMSRRTVYRMFAGDGGVARYLTERRLARAFGELSAASPSRGLIYAVAERNGFVDQNHFSRLFRNRYHIAPSEAVGL